MPSSRQPRCFARLNTWGEKLKEGREGKKNWRSCRGCPVEVTSRSRLPAAPPQPPDPPHLQERPQLLFGHADHQADLQQARGQHVLHGTAARQHGAARAGRTRRSAAFPQRRPSPPLRRPRGGAAPSGGSAPSSPLREFRFLIGHSSRRSEDATNKRGGIELGGLFGAGLRLLSPPGLRGSPAPRMAAAAWRPSRLLLRESSWGSRSPPQGEAPCFIPRENKPFFFFL